MHENKAVLSVVLMAVSLIVMIMAFYGLPDDLGNEGSGPLAYLTGWNYILIMLTFVSLVVGGYVIYRYVTDKARFEELMSTNSQAIFKRNQIEIERLALRLTSREEKRVVEAMKKYKIK
ncbi:MAG: DUF3198 domain-containing protein, partial [Thermoplasmata archaeon]|nr:DUF3198 domain-containing protein [Thermoplasmata archaeon]